MSGAVLVPRYPKDDAMQKTKVVTDSSEFWEEDVGEKTFTVQCDSNSSIEILWTPLHQYWQTYSQTSYENVCMWHAYMSYAYVCRQDKLNVMLYIVL